MGIGDIGFLQQNPAQSFSGGVGFGLNTVKLLQDASRANDARNMFAEAAQTGQVNPLLAAASPELFQQANASQSAQATAQSEAEQAELQRQLDSAARDSKTALSITNPASRQEFLLRRIDEVDARGGDSSDTRAIMALPFEQQNIEFQDAINQVADLSNALPADQQAFQSLIGGFSAEDQEAARRIKAGLNPRATGSAAQTIAGSGTVEDVAGVEQRLAESKSAGAAIGEAKQANIVAKAKSTIAKAVQAATIDAKSKGETLSELNKANASLPGLKSVVDELKNLAPLATSTISGNGFDFMAKEFGFGATKGATAKANFVSVINNQVLPLLKQTFGAAFTKAEGDELKKTMGDPDASPEEKIVQLNSFIEGKYREIQAKERELGQEVTPTEELA